MNPSLPLRSPEMISLPLSLSQHKPRHRIGQGATSGSPGPLGAWVPGPSPRAEGPVVAAWAGLESRAMAEAERPSYQGSQRRTPFRCARQAGGLCPWGLRLWLGSPTGQAGLQCSMWPKDGSTTPPQASATVGLLEGPIQQGVCMRQGLGRGLVLCPPGLPVGTTALGWASWKVWLMWPRPGATGGSLHSGGLWPLSQNCSLNLRGDLLFQCGTV